MGATPEFIAPGWRVSPTPGEQEANRLLPHTPVVLAETPPPVQCAPLCPDRRCLSRGDRTTVLWE